MATFRTCIIGMSTEERYECLIRQVRLLPFRRVACLRARADVRAQVLL